MKARSETDRKFRWVPATPATVLELFDGLEVVGRIVWMGHMDCYMTKVRDPYYQNGWRQVGSRYREINEAKLALKAAIISGNDSKSPANHPKNKI